LTIKSITKWGWNWRASNGADSYVARVTQQDALESMYDGILWHIEEFVADQGSSVYAFIRTKHWMGAQSTSSPISGYTSCEDGNVRKQTILGRRYYEPETSSSGATDGSPSYSEIGGLNGEKQSTGFAQYIDSIASSIVFFLIMHKPTQVQEIMLNLTEV
jgi:hypothetical protein